MLFEPDRRTFLAGVAAAAAAPFLPGRALAAEQGSIPAYRSATDLAAALADKKISSRELIDAAIARIEALDPKINAVVVRDFDRARAAAKAADEALAKGERKPLLGLPMTVKEQYRVAGLPTCWGHAKYKDWKPDTDSLVVQRLKSAGAVILGKTNVPVDLSDWQSFNEVYGTTNNPWDFGRTPGGSSGGSAAALAAGFVPLELGSDIGGSLRAPAHFCGVYAHKTSLDIVPQRGIGFPETPANPVRGDMSVIGPMARSAADLAFELEVIAGPDELWEGIGYKLALPAPRHDKLADYRVLVIDSNPLVPTAESVRGALNALADRLAKSGCKLSRDTGKTPYLARTIRNYGELLLAFFSRDLPPKDRAEVEAFARNLSPEDQSLSAYRTRGITIGHPEWIRASSARSFLRARWQELFRNEFDVVLCPCMPTPAWPHDHSMPEHDRKLDVDGKTVPYIDQIVWASIATLTGLPATAAPIAKSDTGLPIGVQIIGGFHEDRTTIEFAELIEREYGGFTPPPNFV
ncbi:MAG: amidase [Alphaproteobacteria bacterium]|nr:amidase [Alphaproteobacteria bacterium]